MQKKSHIEKVSNEEVEWAMKVMPSRGIANRQSEILTPFCKQEPKGPALPDYFVGISKVGRQDIR